MSREFLIIANPISGGGRSQTKAPQLRDALVARGCGAELYFTERGGDAKRRAAEVGLGQYEGVISVGGDGTLNEVLNGLPDPSIPLGILAMGTANALALELRLPRDPTALADILATGHTRPVAIGLVEDRRFLLCVSSGLDANIVQRIEEVRSGTLGKRRWIGPILHTLRRWPLQSRQIRTDEGIVHQDVTTVVISRTSSYGGILTLPGGIDVGDGLLHALVFKQRGRWRYFCAVIRALFGRLRVGADVIHLPTRGLRVEAASDAVWQVDGDLGGKGDIRISLHTTPARLFAPPPTS
ncbi:MAG: diacylglycerol kinase family protein [Planctomycetota bacterium]|nr:diacylglycerol kinase family protein [Planctomycetota bacterium]